MAVTLRLPFFIKLTAYFRNLVHCRLFTLINPCKQGIHHGNILSITQVIMLLIVSVKLNHISTMPCLFNCLFQSICKFNKCNKVLIPRMVSTGLIFPGPTSRTFWQISHFAWTSLQNRRRPSTRRKCKQYKENF